MTEPTSRPTRAALAAFAAPCLALAALGLPLVVYLPNYYSADLGLSLSAVGAAFMAVRLLDIGLDPVLGALMDRTRTRFGRFKPWLVAGAPILMAATAMLFFARPGVGPAYLWGGLLLGYGGWSICVLAQTSWGATLSPDYNQRSRIYAWWQTANVIGLIGVLLLPVIVARISPAGDDSLTPGMHAMGWLVLLLIPTTIAFAAWRVKEPRPAAGGDIAGFAQWRALFGSAAVRRLILSDVVLGLVPGVAAALFLFYFTQIKALPQASANAALLLYFIAALIGAPMWSWLADRIGKHTALGWASLFYLVGQAGFLVLPSGSLALAAAAAFVAGLPYSAASVLLRAMMADVGDEERLKSGVDRTGLLYAMLTGATKVGAAVAVGVTFIGLDLAGFKAAGGNSANALLGLQLLFLALPAALSVWAAVILFRYPLDAERHAAVRAALDAEGR
jgi:Na+/melibiose symporter-like transporter